MERRSNERIRVRFEARMIRKGTQDSVVVTDVSPGGLSLLLPFDVNTGELIEFEMADSVVSARVVYSNVEADSHRVGLKIERVRLGASDLSRLLQRTLHDAIPDTPGLEVVEVNGDCV